MKKNIFISILIMLAGILILSCDDNDKNENVHQITVASVKRFTSIEKTLPTANNKSIGSNDIMLDFIPTLYIKSENKDNWEIFEAPGIDGFIHEEGYEYILKVKSRKTGYACPEMSVSLVKEISKIKKDSENIPLQRKSITIASKKTGNKAYPYRILRGDKWTKFPNIEGFDSEYEEGYEYEIEIDCKYNGANASPKYSFIYSKTTEKEKKESEGLSFY